MDRYLFSVGDGQDRITDYSTASGEIDHIVFDNTLSANDFWFARNGNDLDIYTIGADDKVSITNWYSNGYYQIESIEVGNAVLMNTQVDQLVSAMAAYDSPQGAGSVVPQAVQDELAPVIAQTWQIK